MTTAEKIRFDRSSSFLTELRRRIDRYFERTRLSPRDCPGMYVKTGIILAWFFLSYGLLVFWSAAWWQAVPLTVSLGLASAAIGFNIQHDGGHGAYSRHGWINRITAMTMDMLGGSSFVWAHKHNILHHTYTNIAGHDDDIDTGFLARFSPQQRRLRVHRLQHLYVWVPYALISLKWQLIDDFRNVATGRISGHRFPRPRGWDLVQFVGGKLCFFLMALVVPSLFHPFWVVFLFYAIASAVQGLVLSVVFQLAHVVSEASFPEPDAETGRIDTPWAIHQLKTTVDFARGNRALSWFAGGLNFQVEHHLFPRICHLHYPRISRIVERACRRNGIEYHSHPTIFSAIRSHYRWLKAMGKPAS